VRGEPSGAMLVLRNFAPASRGFPRLANVKDCSIGATITLTLSSPELPGGPNAATGSATVRFCGLECAELVELTQARDHMAKGSLWKEISVQHQSRCTEFA